MLSSRKNHKSLPPVPNKHNGYLEKSFLFLKHGNHQNNLLKIDGGIGDYKMKLFRLKDKNYYQNNIQSIFNESFVAKIMENTIDKANDEKVNHQIKQIIKKPKELYLRGENEQKKEINYEKGNLQNTMEDGQFLFCSYIPKYQRQNWFKVVDNSSQLSVRPRETQNKSENVVVKRKKPNRKHLFAYMDLPHLSKTIES